MQKDRKRGQFSGLDSDFGSEEKFILNVVNEMVGRLRQKYSYSNQEVLNLLQEEELMVPVEVFSSGLAPAEALTKFLKEECDVNFHEISILINRNEKSVWQNYQRAIKKMPLRFAFESSLKVPVSAFKNNKLSVFESLVLYLKEQKQMKNVRIAKLLGKNPANVWSVYNRAIKKVKRGFK